MNLPHRKSSARWSVSSARWSVISWSAWRSRLRGHVSSSHPGAPFAQEVKGARITDKDTGLVYEATIDREAGSVWLSSLTILTARRGQRIDNATMRRIPVQRIAEQVALQLAADEVAHREGLAFSYVTRPRAGKHDRPGLRQIVQEVKAGETRQTLATRYQVSVSTVDNWLGRARREGLLPPAKTGRPPRRRDLNK